MTDINLTPGEISMLAMFYANRASGWIPLRSLTPEARLDVDMLVLSGLCERNRCEVAGQWLNEWRLPDAATTLIAEETLYSEPTDPSFQVSMFT